jgi:hypothetical protein
MLIVSEFANGLFDAAAGPGRVGRIVPASWRVQTRASVLLGVGWREGGADGVAPGVGVEGVDVFVLGELDGLQKGLAEVGEGGGGSGFYLTLGDGGEELAQGSAKVASGEIAAGEAGRDIAAGLLGGGGLSFLAGVKRQRCGWLVQRGVRHWRPSAKENEHREARSLERLEDIGISRQKKLDF